MVDTLLERALEVRDGFGTAPKSHSLAEIISTLAADAALTAGNANFKRNAVSNVEARHLRPDGNDGT